MCVQHMDLDTVVYLFMYLIPHSQRALCVFGEDDGDPLQLTDVPTDTVLKNTSQEATRCSSGCHR